MFWKLLKHEWRGARGLVGLICGITVLSGLTAGGILRYIIWFAANGNDAVVSAYSVLLTVAVCAYLGCCVLPVYLLAYRFYKTRFTAQGYLTMVLPVTTHQQLLACIVNILICVVLVSATALVSAGVGLGFFLNMFDGATRGEILQNLGDAFSGVRIGLLVSETELGIQLPAVPFAMVADVVLLMLALTVGAQAQEHPLMKGAAVYIVTDFLVSEGCGLIAQNLDNRALAAGISCAVYAALAVVAYLTMHRIFEKRLNLT